MATGPGTACTSVRLRLSPRLTLTGQATTTDTTMAPGPTLLTTATGPGTACTSVMLMPSQRLRLMLTTAATTGQATTTGLPTTPTTGPGTVTTVTSDVTLTTTKTAMTAK